MSENTTLCLIGQIRITGRIRALTGLCIGGSDTGLGIGGADKTVIRNALDGRPYIPGSSLKGKMRCMLDRVYPSGRLESVGQSKVFKCASAADYADVAKSFIFHLFGVTPEEIKNLGGQAMPTRLLVRDAMMAEETVRALENSLYTDMPLTQVKTEVVIDRITSAATPRQIERVPAGALFDYEIVFNVYRDSDLDMLTYVAEAMDLLEHDYLGGQGSRGYGHIRFVTRDIEVKSFNGRDLGADPRVTTWAQSIHRDDAPRAN